MNQYRVPLLTAMRDSLEHEGVNFRVAYGQPVGELKERGDAVQLPWGTQLATQSVRALGRGPNIKLKRQFWATAKADLVIVEHALTSLDPVLALLGARASGVRFGLWGQGKLWTEPESPAAVVIRRRMALLADHYFAYTPTGASLLARGGMPASRLSVLENSTDTTSLRRELTKLSSEDIAAFADRHRLDLTRTAWFLGSVDQSKRPDFLSAAVSRVAALAPGFRLLLVGSGPGLDALRASPAAAHCIFLGRQTGRELALAARCSKVMLMPGRVGLCAVDSFACETPIVTTRWQYHAPEFDYLNETNSIVTQDSVDEYASRVATILADANSLNRLRTGCRESADHYTVQNMSRNFVRGIIDSLDMKPRLARR